MNGDIKRRDAAHSIIGACRQGLAPDALRTRILPLLMRAVPADAVWWATADPATLLFTGTYQEEIPAKTKPYFVQNEFLADDVNKWTDVARDEDGVRTLVQATGGELSRSARYSEVFEPLGFGDELRAVFRVNGASWGLVCLHREGRRAFSRQDVLFMKSISPHVALGLRAGLVGATLDEPHGRTGPGVVLLSSDLAVTGWNQAADRWLDELGYDRGPDAPLPTEILAVAARLGDGSDAGLPRLRVRTRAGRWAVLHASRLPSREGDAIAVIIDGASGAEVASIIMLAYGLSPQERTITGLVCRGISTIGIASDMGISANTVQDHLKSVFDKIGVRSRRELVVQILGDHYVPHAQAGRPIGPSGYFS